MARIAVIDDKEILRESLETALTREDHNVTTFDDPVEALEVLKRERFDVILTDLKMPRMDGIALIRELESAGCDTPIIMMTAFATVATAVEAMKIGAFDYVQKPFEVDSVLVLIERAIEHGRLKRDNEAYRASADDLHNQRRLVGTGKTMTALRAQLDQVAASHATVLICGESGTGKELVSAYIQRHSPRADRPMLCLNCAALSANLLESELFGHERGAYTGADRTRRGRFELADGGTLLLDEISELAPNLQAKLLRVLQEGEFERVGSSTTRRADVRIIATTNRNLEEWVVKKRFREDLFYRLNVLPVNVAPLRERKEDIVELIEYFTERAAIASGATGASFSKAAIEMMTDYEWPGNVRELENICCRAVTLCTGKEIDTTLIEPWIKQKTGRVLGTFSSLREGQMLQDMERQLIERTLQRFNGHRAKTAKALGMGVRTLGMKLKQWREEAESNRRAMETAGVAM